MYKIEYVGTYNKGTISYEQKLKKGQNWFYM
jgi:hypothetical protein